MGGFMVTFRPKMILSRKPELDQSGKADLSWKDRLNP